MITCLHLLHLFGPENNTQHFLSATTESQPTSDENRLCHFHFLWPPSIQLFTAANFTVACNYSSRPQLSPSLYPSPFASFISLICSNLPQSWQADSLLHLLCRGRLVTVRGENKMKSQVERRLKIRGDCLKRASCWLPFISSCPSGLYQERDKHTSHIHLTIVTSHLHRDTLRWTDAFADTHLSSLSLTWRSVQSPSAAANNFEWTQPLKDVWIIHLNNVCIYVYSLGNYENTETGFKHWKRAYADANKFFIFFLLKKH